MRHLQYLDQYLNSDENWRDSTAEELENIADLFREEDYPYRARAFYELSIKQDPNRPSSHFKLGTLCFLMCDYQRAAGVLGTVLDVDPTYYEAHFHLGRAHLYRESLREAYRHLTAWLNMAAGRTSDEEVKIRWARKVVAGLEKNGLGPPQSQGCVPL